MHIQFGLLEAKNATTFQHLKIDLGTPGLNLILGHNSEDGQSNGSGKSNIFEIVNHILFGNTGKTIKKDSIIRWSSDSGYRGSLCVSIGGKDLQIEQWRGVPKSGNGMRVVLAGEDLSSDLNTTQTLPQQILGMTPHEWTCLCYLMQGYAHPFLDNTRGGKSRRDLLSQIYSLRFGDYLRETKDQLKQLQNDLTESESNIQGRFEQAEEERKEIDLDETVEKLESVAVELLAKREEKKHKEVQATRFKEFSKLRASIDKAETALEDTTTKPSAKKTPQAMITDWVDSISGLESALPLLKRRSRITEELGTLEEKVQDVDEPEALGPEIVRLTKKLKKNAGLYLELNRSLGIAHELKELIGERDASEFKFSGQEHLDQLKTQVANLKVEGKELSHRRKLVEAGKCSECGQDIHDDQTVETLDAAISQCKTDCQRIKNEVGNQETNAVVDKLFGKLPTTSLSTFFTGLIEAEERVKLLQKKIRRLEKLQRTFGRITELQESLGDIGEVEDGCPEDVSDQIAKLKGKLAKAREQNGLWVDYETTKIATQKRIADLKSQLKEMGKVTEVSSEDTKALQAVIDSILEERARLKQKIARVKELNKLVRDLKKRRQGLDAKREKISTYEILSYLFGPKGFSLRIGGIVKQLNERFERYISILFPEYRNGFRCRIASSEEEIYLDCESSQGYEATMASLSGGERRKVAIAAMLSLRDYTPHHKQSNLLVLDEFDQHCTEDNRHRIIDALEDHRSQNPETAIWVITHSEGVQTRDCWNRVIRVNKKKGSSSLETVVG